MALKDKVAKVLQEAFDLERIDLADEDGVYGYIVSDCFKKMDSLKRQKAIDKLFREGPVRFTKRELQRILSIAPLTRLEFASLGPRVG